MKYYKTILIFSLLLICRTTWAQETNQPSTLISSFKTIKSVSQWEKTGVTFKLDTTTEATASARLHFSKYKNGGEQWPGIKVNLKKQGLSTNWQAYDYLKFDYSLLTNNRPKLGILIRSKKGHYYTKPLIATDGWYTSSIKIPHKTIDSKHMKSITIYITRPSHNTDILIRNVRLVSNIPKKLENLSTSYSNIGMSSIVQQIQNTHKEIVQNNLSLKIARKRIQKWENSLRQHTLEHFRSLFYKNHPHAPMALTFANSMTRIFPQDIASNMTSIDNNTIKLARNEYQARQIVAIAPKNKALSDVQIKVGEFTLKNNREIKLSKKAIDFSPVGFVKTTSPSYPVNYVGWYPDPILEFMDKVDIKPNTLQPFWIRVHASKNTKPGLYKGKLTVKTSSSDKKIIIPLRIRVWDFTLPKKSHFKTAASIRKGQLRRFKTPSIDKIRSWLLKDYRYNYGGIYSGGTYTSPEAKDIHTVNIAKKHTNEGMNSFNMLYLSLPRQVLGKSPKQSQKMWHNLSKDKQQHYPKKEIKRDIEVLGKLVKQAKKEGIYNLSYLYGFDEALPSSWHAITELITEIHKHYPDLKIISTIKDPSYGTKSILGGVLHGYMPGVGDYNPKLAAKVRKKGNRVWYYTTKLRTEQPLIQMRLVVGMDAFRVHSDGFMTWTLNRWNSNKKAITSGPYTHWNPEGFPTHNGSACLFMPGPNRIILPTIRLENLRDGLEDYEYLYLLKQLIKQNPSSKATPKAQQILDYCLRPKTKQMATKFSFMLKDPKKLRARRIKIARAILSLQNSK